MPKSVLITGCSAGGIGHSLAMSFQKRGLTVFATARNLSSMSALEKLPNMHLLSLDVTSSTSITSAFEQVRSQTGGKLDYLVNNAGRNNYMPALDSDIEEGKKIFETNFWGVLNMVQVFAPLLLEAKGTVVNIGSINAYLYPPYTSIYNATKAAVHILGETLRVELAPLNIKVLTVVTGSIATNIRANIVAPCLPDNSCYKPIEETIKERAIGDDGIARSGPEEFAEKVVGDVLAGATGKIYRGKHASLVRFGSAFFPMAYVDHVLVNGTGLGELGKK